MDKLPKGWVLEPIENVFKIKSGAFLPSKKLLPDGKFPVYGGNGITGYFNDFNLKDDNIIIGRVGAKCGNIRLINGAIWVTDNAFYISEYKNDVNKKYLSVYLEFVDLGSTANQAAQPVISYKSIKDIQIPLPPLPEQKRIASKLDALFERIDKSMALLEENIKQTESLITSSLDGIFDELSEKYPVEPLLKHVDFIGGSQPPKSNFSDTKKDGFVRLIQIRDYKSDNHIVYIDEKSTKKFCNADDVMIGRYGPPVFQILRGLEGAYNVALMKAIPNENVVSKDFLFYFLQNEKIQNYIISISQRSAGQSGVNKKALEQYDIVIPPLDIQEKVVNKIKGLQDNLTKLQNEQNDKLNNLKSLKDSVLDKAFKGEL